MINIIIGETMATSLNTGNKFFKNLIIFTILNLTKFFFFFFYVPDIELFFMRSNVRKIETGGLVPP